MSLQQTQLKYVTRFAYGDSLSQDEEDRQGTVPVFGSNGPFAYYPYSNTNAPVIVIGRKGSYGKINWSEKPVYASDTTFFVDSSTTQHNLRWLYYLLQILRLDEGSSEAAVPGLNRNDAYQTKVFVPPLPEQRAIADYLDRKTAVIDDLLAEKQRLLEVLAEKRQALITQAVTRGLDGAVPLRDSGIDIWGTIPAHWGIVHLRRVLRSMDYGISESVGIEGDVAVLRMGDVYEGEISFGNVGFVSEVDSHLLLKPGDLLFNRTNSLAQVGKVGIFRESPDYPISFASYLVRMRCNGTVLPDYLNYLLNSSPTLIWARSEALPSIGQANLNPNRYSYLPIPLPPIEEQQAAIDFLQIETAKIDDLYRATEDTITLLQERRTALIAAAVTGQIEVTE